MKKLLPILIIFLIPSICSAGMGGPFGLMTLSASTSNGADVTPPAFSSATANADACTITLTEDVVITLLDDGDFVMTGSTTGAQNLNSCTEDAGVISCTSATAFVTGETITLAYSGTADPAEVADLSGNPLGTFSGESVTNNTPGASYVIEEDCESGQNGWTTVTGTPNYAYATSPAPLDGSYSFYLDGTSADVIIEKTLSGVGASFWSFAHIIHYSAAADRYMVIFVDDGDVVRGAVRINASGCIQARVHTTNGTYSSSCMTMNGTTDYYLWTRFNGSTGEMWAAFTSDQTAPTDPGANCGSVSANMTCADLGSSATTPTKFRLEADGTVNVGVFDKIRVDDEAIGSSPP